LLRWLCLVFSAPVLLLLGKPLALDALDNIRRRVLSSDLLLLTGVAAAFTYSTWTVVRGEGSVYFETGCVILVFVTLGRWLAATGRLKTTEVLDGLQRLLPDTVRLIRADGAVQAAIESISIGDLILVLAGERIPVDGEITHGSAAIDEQVFTGESEPVGRIVGDRVFAGTLNLDGSIRVRATALPGQGAFGSLVDAVRTAREAKGRYQTAADRMAELFFPAITVIAITTLLAHGWTRGWTEGWLAALAVVLIACPCALALATPLAVWAALGRAARRGVLFRSGEAIERLAAIAALRFDKTGTITTGTPSVASEHIATGTGAEEFRARAGSLARGSSHVFSRAILQQIGESPEPLLSPEAIRTVSGCGLEAAVPGETGLCRLGSWDWLRQSGASPPPELEQVWREAQAGGQSVVGVAWGGRIQGLYLLVETVRENAADVLRALELASYDVAVLTGDHPARAARLSEELGVPAVAALSPEAKAIEVRLVQEQIGPAAMVGDGFNDAPALAAADVGIALGCGTDVTRDSADVCLLGDDLASIPWSVELARETVHVIRGNLAWAFGYNAIGVVLAATGWLHPSVAAVLMVVSSVVVISRSLKLGRDGGLTSLGDRDVAEDGVRADDSFGASVQDPEQPQPLEAAT